MMRELAPDVGSLLARNGISGEEVPFEHDGYSGCRMSRIASGGRSYVVKRAVASEDWIIQMTSDHALREARIAVSDVLAPLRTMRSPSIDAARDGEGFALLMHDVTPHLISTGRRMEASVATAILAAAADMHALYWDGPPAEDAGWCGQRERLLMLAPETAERMDAAGFEVGMIEGWKRFHAWAPRDVSELVRRLHGDPSRLLDVLSTFPQTLLHNDIKAANCAFDGETVWLFDWALSGIGPVCLELGWFLVVNADLLLWGLDETFDRYGSVLRSALPRASFENARWAEQRALASIAGLMTLGWAKVARAEAGDDSELRWWCDGARVAARGFGL